jgi:hypothetical protein
MSSKKKSNNQRLQNQRRSRRGRNPNKPIRSKNPSIGLSDSKVSGGGLSQFATSVGALGRGPYLSSKDIHTKFGHGIQCTGRTAICTWQRGASDQPFIDLATGAAATYIDISASQVGSGAGALYLASQSWRRYRFTMLKFVNEMSGNTNVNCPLTMNYTGDGAVVNDYTYFSMISSPLSINFPIYYSRAVLDVTHSIGNSELYYTDFDDAGGDSGLRQSVQGVLGGILGSPGAITIGVLQGVIYLDYVVEFYEPALQLNVALSRAKLKQSKLERKARLEKANLELKTRLILPVLSFAEGEPSSPAEEAPVVVPLPSVQQSVAPSAVASPVVPSFSVPPRRFKA